LKILERGEGRRGGKAIRWTNEGDGNSIKEL
jgi:hypothetical protein